MMVLPNQGCRNPMLFHHDINPENALENLFRAETNSNQRLRRLIFSNHSAAMLLENKALIYCILGSHNEVLMHYPG
jgi:hypothetical protein